MLVEKRKSGGKAQMKSEKSGCGLKKFAWSGGICFSLNGNELVNFAFSCINIRIFAYKIRSRIILYNEKWIFLQKNAIMHIN